MILPIFAYGQPVLKKKALPISSDYPQLAQVIENMWETMYHASGVGLAAPQVGLPIRLFVIDSEPMLPKEDKGKGVKKVFINAEIIEQKGELCSYEEGCLSIPDVRGDIERLDTIRLKYQDEQFNWHEDTFSGTTARVIQHEYDHIEGKLFIDHISLLKRKLMKGKLNDISKGKISVDYKMSFPK